MDLKEHEGLIRDVMRRLFGGIAETQEVAKTRGMDIEDIYQIGYLAMWRASKRFNPEKGEWSTFASWYISTSILTELNRLFPIKMPYAMSVKEKVEKSKVGSLYMEVESGEGLYLIDCIPSTESLFTEEVLAKYDFEMMVDTLLSEHERKALYKWYYDDLTHQDIALQMGCTRRGVSAMIKRAKNKLSQEVS